MRRRAAALGPPRPSLDAVSRARRAAALTLIACTLLVAVGVALVQRAPVTAASVAAAPLVRVRDAAIAAGDAAPVRLQGTLVAMPPLTTAAGRPVALQLAEIGGDADGPATYRRAAPPQLFLTDGDSLVQLAAADADPAYLPFVGVGRVGDDGRLPPDLRVHLVPELVGLPREPGTLVRLHAIDAESPVLAHGRLVLEEGVPTLRPPIGAASLVLTTMSAAEVDRDRRRAARGRLALGWALVGVGALGALGAAVVALRRA